MNPSSRFVLVAVLAPAIACAQSVAVATVSSSALFASHGGSQQNVPVAAGPLASQGSFAASAGNAVASLTWSASIDAHALQVFLTADAFVDGAAPGQASGGPHDFVVAVSSPTPIAIAFELRRSVAGTPGTPIPVTRVDVRDDGVFELDETSPPTVSVNAIAGPAPLRIRCMLGAATNGIGGVAASLVLTGTPGSTLSLPLLPGCSGGGYSVAPRFDGDLDYWVGTMHSGIAAAVFGLATQPVFLGSQAAGPFSPLLPCVLVPRLDFVALLPTLAPQTLVIPPAARPLTVYSQAVWVDASGLSTSTAFQTHAY